MKKWILASVFLLGLAPMSIVTSHRISGLASCSKKDDVIALKLNHGLDVTTPVHQSMEYMARLVWERSGHRLRIDIYPSEQLGDERESIEQLQVGALSMTKTSTAPLESFIPEMAVLSLPYLFRDAEHKWKMLNNDIGRKLLDAGVRMGLKGLCYYDAGSRSFYTINKPIYTPTDLKGMKIRVQKSATAIEMMKAFRASATPISWGELYTALQQGVVDGAENNPPSFYLSRHYEVCKYYSLDEHTHPPDILLISNEVWNKLPQDLQVILLQAALESSQYHRRLWNEEVQRSLRAVEEAGVQIIRPDKTAFAEAIAPFHLKYENGPLWHWIQQIRAVR